MIKLRARSGKFYALSACNLVLAVLLAIAAALPLLIGPGILNTRAGGDSPFLLQRVHQIGRNIEAGIWPARWMPDAAYGLGYPAFNFYAALPYYVAALLARAGLGILWGIKLTQVAGFALAGLAFYGLVREIKLPPTSALVAAAVYTFAPFHLANVYVRGDSLSEFWAMGLYPLLLWLGARLRRDPSPTRVGALALAYAALLLSHNISALLFSPVLLSWFIIEALHSPPASPRRFLLAAGVALTLGLLSSAWFWAPALHEAPLVQLDEQTTGYLHFAGHFRDGALVQLRWIHDYTIGHGADPFRTGAVQAALALAGLGAAVVLEIRWRAPARQAALQMPATWGPIGYTLVGAFWVLASTWLMTSASRWAWEHVPLLAFAQFPWRLLAIQAVGIALLAANLPRLGHGLLAQLLALGICGLAAVAGLVGLPIDRLPLREGEVNIERLAFYETYSGNIGTTIRHEYLPREMIPRPYTSAVQWNGGQKPAPLALSGEMRGAVLLKRTPEKEVWEIEVREKSLLAFHSAFFPGWEAEVDGRRQGVEPLPGLGLIGLRLEPGRHRVRLFFEDTATRRAASWLSLLGLAIACTLLLLPALRDARRRRRWVLGGGALALVGAWIWLAPIPASETQSSGPLVADMDRAPYLHVEPSGVFWGAARLLDYTLTPLELVPGDVLDVTLCWDTPRPELRLEIELVGATAHLFRPEPVWARAGQNLDARQMTVSLRLPPYLAPGLYVLRPRLYLGNQELVPRTARGQAMGRLVLRPIQVREAIRASGEEQVIAWFGPPYSPPEIALLRADTSWQGREVTVELLWRSERQASLNYWLSLRIVRPDGSHLVSRDLPPLLGGCPTSLWRPGTLLQDRVILKVPREERLGPGYALEVVLYDRRTLQAVGTATLDNLF
ncbi:MAG: hypothetical protein H5T69_06420 [Chloroflexi bacterium]|nr:hypothetical protein [Chloroflexota bacterium]